VYPPYGYTAWGPAVGFDPGVLPAGISSMGLSGGATVYFTYTDAATGRFFLVEPPLTISAVPEPGSIAFGLGGLMLLALRARRRILDRSGTSGVCRQ
jgi:uncharacterized protein (TIGR03382 family)